MKEHGREEGHNRMYWLDDIKGQNVFRDGTIMKYNITCPRRVNHFYDIADDVQCNDDNRKEREPSRGIIVSQGDQKIALTIPLIAGKRKPDFL